MQRKEFFRKLTEVYQKGPSDEALEQYLAKLSSWKITSKQLASIYEMVVERCGFFPSIADLTSIAGECGVKVTRQARPVSFLCFDRAGHRYASILKSPSAQPALPWADNRHLCVAPEVQAEYDVATQDQGRAAFREGWLAGGGHPAKLSAYFDLMTERPHTHLSLPPAPEADEVPF